MGLILDARITDRVLHLVSTEFKRLEVPIADIPALAGRDPKALVDFEIDEDGSFLYWPALDVHLGWDQLQQIMDPEATRKALQKSRAFNRRYGKAVQRVREAAGLKANDIGGLSSKQLRRIEEGECRLTANGIEALSAAHGLKADDYLQKLAEALKTEKMQRGTGRS